MRLRKLSAAPADKFFPRPTIVSALGHDKPAATEASSPEGEKSLLNGPQLQGHGASQEEIDAILAGFDS